LGGDGEGGGGGGGGGGLVAPVNGMLYPVKLADGLITQIGVSEGRGVEGGRGSINYIATLPQRERHARRDPSS